MFDLNTLEMYWILFFQLVWCIEMWVRGCSFLSIDTMQLHFQLIVYAKVFRLTTHAHKNLWLERKWIRKNKRAKTKKMNTWYSIQASLETVPIGMHFPWVLRNVQQMKIEKGHCLAEDERKVHYKNASSKTYSFALHTFTKATKHNQPECNLNLLTQIKCIEKVEKIS